MKNLRTKYLILGAGPTGLGAAWKMAQCPGEDWLLCEAEETAGGLASSIVDEHGFTWDLGGHVQFSHYDYFDDLMDELLGGDGWLYHQRESWVWLHQRLVPYPFQLNLRYLPMPELWDCVRGVLKSSQAQAKSSPANFGEWIDAVFGEGIARVFLRPYNFKVWAYPPEMMSWGWIGDRVAVVDLERVLKNIFEQRDDVSWGPNSQFRFPKRGGTGSIWLELAKRLEARRLGSIHYRHRLTALHTSTRTAQFENGVSVQYERVISTLPLDKLIQLSDLSEKLGQAANQLKYSSTHIIGVGVRGKPSPDLQTKCWMYFPEQNCPFYRVTLFSNYSPQNVPDISQCWSLMAEVSESEKKPVNGETVVAETLDGMLNTGLVRDRVDFHHTWHRRLDHGYPTPSLHRDEALAEIQPVLERAGVYSRGRFGAWKYEVSNQDHSFGQGVEVADFLVNGTPEVTLPFPEKVNSRKPRPLRPAAT